MKKFIYIFLILLTISSLFANEVEEENNNEAEFARLSLLFDQGIDLFQQGDFEVAKLNFTACLSDILSPEGLENVRFYLGSSEFYLGNYEESIKNLLPIISNPNFDPFYSYAYDYLIQSYNKLEQPEKAETIKQKFYTLNRDNLLEERTNSYFCFDTFEYNGYKIYAEESLVDLDTPESEGSFSKIILYVYELENNPNSNLSFTIEAVKIHTNEGENDRYLMNKRFIKNGQVASSFSFWQYQYDYNIDYQQFVLDARSVLDELAETQAYSAITVNEEKSAPEISKKTEPEILDMIKAIKANPLDADTEIKLNYIFEWVVNEPSINLIIDTKYIKDINDDENYPYMQLLLSTFYYSIVEYMLENDVADSRTNECIEFGLTSFIQVYEQISAIREDAKGEAISEMVKAIKKEGISDYVNRLNQIK